MSVSSIEKKHHLLIPILMIIFSVFGVSISATVINIPADQPTIQDGINTAVNFDTVLVASGTYFENED